MSGPSGDSRVTSHPLGRSYLAELLGDAAPDEPWRGRPREVKVYRRRTLGLAGVIMARELEGDVGHDGAVRALEDR